jgi:para-aminobenzoate synthetase component 1
MNQSKINQLSKEKYFAVLHSGMKTNYSSGKSLLAYNAVDVVEGDNFKQIKHKISQNKSKYENFWVGYFSYDLKNSLENLPEDEDFFITSPKMFFVNFANVEIIDSDQINFPLEEDKTFGLVKYLKSNMSQKQYLGKVSEILKLIKNGEIYQANLTRKFYGEFNEAPDNLKLFGQLCNISPSPYSAYLKLDDLHIISSSPEQFIKVENGMVEARPIKGSHIDENFLRSSEKDKSENLMITDLMRNDFSKFCEAGSVRVENLFEITKFATINHMSSTIKGQIKSELGAYHAIKNSFPPGSMTGAPKIRAMEVLSQLERHKRGIYSGALGYFGGDGSADFSVVIRTLITRGNKFEFQVGGGIVSDSTPENEWEETILKATSIARLLGIEMEVAAI